MASVTGPAAARLKAEIAHELRNIEHVRDEILVRRDVTDDTTTYALALLLMNYYTGVERVFERIATLFGGIPGGERWHRQLLEDMALDIDGVRPAVIDMTTADALARLLRFRHVVRSLYAWSLRRGDIDALVSETAETHAALVRDLAGWMEFLDALIRA